MYIKDGKAVYLGTGTYRYGDHCNGIYQWRRYTEFMSEYSTCKWECHQDLIGLQDLWGFWQANSGYQTSPGELCRMRNLNRLWGWSDIKGVAGVGMKVKLKPAQSCLTLCNPMDCTVHRILQARTLEWVTVPFSRGSSQPRDWTQVSCISGGFFTSWATRETQGWGKITLTLQGSC